MKTEEKYRLLTEEDLAPVAAGGGTVIQPDDTEVPDGTLKLFLNGEWVTFMDDGVSGLYGKGKTAEYWFTYAEMAELIHRLLNE